MYTREELIEAIILEKVLRRSAASIRAKYEPDHEDDAHPFRGRDIPEYAYLGRDYYPFVANTTRMLKDRAGGSKYDSSGRVIDPSGSLRSVSRRVSRNILTSQNIRATRRKTTQAGHTSYTPNLTKEEYKKRSSQRRKQGLIHRLTVSDEPPF